MTTGLLVALLTTGSLAPSRQDSVLPRRLSRPGLTIEYADADAAAERFFGSPFPRPFTVRVFPNRASLTAHWSKSWGVSDLKPECWMIASGVANELALLSPRAWPAEACEHDPADTAATRRVLWTGWTTSAGSSRVWRYWPRDNSTSNIGTPRARRLPPGRHRPNWPRPGAAAGGTACRDPSLGYVDRTWGRATVTAMLADTTQSGLLDRLRIGEAALLAQWQTAAGRPQ